MAPDSSVTAHGVPRSPPSFWRGHGQPTTLDAAVQRSTQETRLGFRRRVLQQGHVTCLFYQGSRVPESEVPEPPKTPWEGWQRWENGGNGGAMGGNGGGGDGGEWGGNVGEWGGVGGEMGGKWGGNGESS